MSDQASDSVGEMGARPRANPLMRMMDFVGEVFFWSMMGLLVGVIGPSLLAVALAGVVWLPTLVFDWNIDPLFDKLDKLLPTDGWMIAMMGGRVGAIIGGLYGIARSLRRRPD